MVFGAAAAVVAAAAAAAAPAALAAPAAVTTQWLRLPQSPRKPDLHFFPDAPQGSEFVRGAQQASASVG